MILLKTDMIYLCYNIHMDEVNEIEILETSVKYCPKKCEGVNCHAIYDAIMSSLKLIYDLISSNRILKRSWAYTSENISSPLASKLCPLRKPTTTSKGTDQGEIPKLFQMQII